MDNEVQVFADDDGLLVLGSAHVVGEFLESQSLLSRSRLLDPRRLRSVLAAGADLTAAASHISENSGRWLKLTEESAHLVREHGLIDTDTPGVRHLMIGAPGKVRSWLQTESDPVARLTNPAVLSGIGGLLAQASGQQAMAEITDYLVAIDEKLDDVRKSQKNQVLARMDGAQLAIEEARTVWATVGRVSDVTWSKVASTSSVILDTQSYAIRELADLATKLEQTSRPGKLASASRDAAPDVRLWLSVLARGVQLQDAATELELEKVFEMSVEEANLHRLGLREARQIRLARLSAKTDELLLRLDPVVDRANARLVLAKKHSLTAIAAANDVAAIVNEFQDAVGVDVQQRRWEVRPLRQVADFGARVIQGSRDGTPYVAAAVGMMGLAAGGKKLQDGGNS